MNFILSADLFQFILYVKQKYDPKGKSDTCNALPMTDFSVEGGQSWFNVSDLYLYSLWSSQFVLKLALRPHLGPW